MDEKMFFQIRKIAIDLHEGLTLEVGRLEPIKKGWVVKMKGAQNFEGREGMKKAYDIASETTKHIAGWTDEENELWDVVAVFDNESEAAELAKFMEQMTIYQIETGTLRWID